MTFKTKLTIVAASIGGVLIVGGVVSFLLYRLVVAPLFARSEPPPELEQARVILGADLLTRSEFYKVGEKASWADFADPEKAKSNLDSIEDMAVGELDGQPGLDIGLAGTFGLSLLDIHGQMKKRITYRFAEEKVKVGPFETERQKDSFYNMRILDVEGDGVCEVLAYNGLDGAVIFDKQGRVLLSREENIDGKPSIRDVAAGDIDGDGILEFVAGWGYDPSSIELFDRFGNSKWRLPEEFAPGPFEIVDVDGDGKPEIVEDDGRNLKIRDAQGKVISNPEMPVYLWHLSLCAKPGVKGPPQNLAVREGSLWLIDLDGKNYSKFDAPLSSIKLEKPRKLRTFPGEPDIVDETDDVFRAKGVWIKLKKDQPEYLAVIATFAALDRALFYVYDHTGKLVYHEILPEDGNGIAVLKSEGDNGSETLLIGGDKTVWRYTAR